MPTFLRALNYVSNDMPDRILLVVGRDVDGNRARLEQMSPLTRDRAARRRMGERGRKGVSANFTINRSVAAFERLYSEVAHLGQRHDMHGNAKPILATPMSSMDSFAP
jgi:hypothetical protein